MPFLLLPLSSVNAKAQVELVPNGSFEILSDCPTAGNQIEKAIGWFNCRETPDLCNACSTTPDFQVPSNNFGYQPSSNGVVYADIWTYSVTGLYREVIGASLNQPLIPLHTYKISFKIARACNEIGYCIATNRIGIRFTTIAYSPGNPTPIDNFAHVNIDTVVTDTAGWAVFNEEWIADSAYQYIMLGNFFKDDQTDTIRLNTESAFAIYYIDEVSVIDEKKDGIDNLSLFPFIVNWNNSNLSIKTDQASVDQITICNSIGQIVLKSSQKIEKDSSGSFLLSEISTGMYIVIINSLGNQFIKKLFKF